MLDLDSIYPECVIVRPRSSPSAEKLQYMSAFYMPETFNDSLRVALKRHQLGNSLAVKARLDATTILLAVCFLGVCEITGAALYLKVTDESDKSIIRLRVTPLCTPRIPDDSRSWSPDGLARMLELLTHEVIVILGRAIM